MSNTVAVEAKGLQGLSVLDFPVETQPIFLAGQGNAIEGRRAVVRPDTGAVLGIVSDQYKLVSYKQTYEPYIERLGREGWTVNSVRIEADGSRAYVELDNVIRAVEVKPGDPVGRRLIIGNSYNGSTGIWARGGLRVLWCKNGAVHEIARVHESIRHLGDPLGDIGESAEKFSVNLAGAVSLYRQLSDTPVSKEIAHTVIKEVCGVKKLELVTGFYGAGHAGANQDNAWGLYNSITAYLTHHFGGALATREAKNHEALDLITHPEKVRQIIERERQLKAGSN